eukprot:TRINITY_DN1521_c1_g1_i1.p1 TRINITY_DN1521_c1_g1~~TRINITY_DN1521_c1_g1_i1.p1  ORF type:complete len:116 (+),score=24.70 TRINITY_DN1521_c1_g1_i1:82-429(+)
MGDILDKVMDAVYSDEFLAQFLEFAKSNADNFKESTDGEQKLGNTEIHKRYVELFESSLEDFIKTQGSTGEEFVELCKQAQVEDPESDRGMFYQMVLASVDYDVFVLLMKEKLSK